MSIEYLLARLTAQSSGPRPKEPTGGRPELTASDISLIASHAPHMSFHALMAKCCQDPLSEYEIRKWCRLNNLTEWFENPAYEATRVAPGQLKRLDELAVLAWLDPRSRHALSIGTRACYLGCSHDIFRRNFQDQYAYLVGELQLLESIGRQAVKSFLRRDDSQDA